MSQHPEVERKLLQELDEAGLLVSEQRPDPRKLSREDVCSSEHLPYLKAVLKASLRLTTTSILQSALELLAVMPRLRRLQRQSSCCAGIHGSLAIPTYATRCAREGHHSMRRHIAGKP